MVVMFVGALLLRTPIEVFIISSEVIKRLPISGSLICSIMELPEMLLVLTKQLQSMLQKI